MSDSPCPGSPTKHYPCDPVCERCGNAMDPELDLPAPTGVDVSGVLAHWRMSDGEWLFAQPGHVFDGEHRIGIDAREADALAVLAACAWARKCAREEAS